MFCAAQNISDRAGTAVWVDQKKRPYLHHAVR